MTRGIGKYLREFLAVAAMIVIALLTAYVILQQQRLRIPVLEERPFELKAEFTTAQAVEPGQGQTIRVAGVRIGDVEDVDLEDGLAVVTFGVDREYLPIYRNATVLMRPQTGLKDMFFELDPGSSEAGQYEEGETIPAANTLPDINLDEVLAAVDADSRAYLRLLAVGLGKGLEDNDQELGRVLRAIGPINGDLERLNSTLAKRDQSIARLIHNLNLLSTTVGSRDEDLVELVGASNAALGAVAEQAPDLQRLTGELPGTLQTARRSLADATPFAAQLGPTLDSLRPFARRLVDVAGSTERLAETVTPVIRNELRPLVRAARPVVPELGQAGARYAAAAPHLVTIGKQVNALGNMTAYNPSGAEEPGDPSRNEGYLYWLGWFAHNGNSVFGGQDAHGVYRRLYLTGSCANLKGVIDSIEGPGGPAVAGLITGLGPLFGPGGECRK